MKSPGVVALFVKGLRWSYRRYGWKGAAAFAAASLLLYYLLDREFSSLVEGE